MLSKINFSSKHYTLIYIIHIQKEYTWISLEVHLALRALNSSPSFNESFATYPYQIPQTSLFLKMDFYPASWGILNDETSVKWFDRYLAAFCLIFFQCDLLLVVSNPGINILRQAGC